MRAVALVIKSVSALFISCRIDAILEPSALEDSFFSLDDELFG